MDIKAALRPRCPKHPAFEQEDCLICTMETPQERDARMTEFHKRFPALVAVAERHGVPGYDQWDQQKEGEWDGVDERIYD